MENEEIDLWATDEVHFQQYGSRCRMWVPPEIKDPILLHHPGRKSVGYFGAVRLRDGKFLFEREQDRFNAETFLTFLKRLRVRAMKSRRRIIVITDNAKYHHAKLHKLWRLANERARLPTAIQSGAQSHRAGMETDASDVCAQ